MLSIIQLARGYFRCLISFQNWNLSRNFLARILFHGRNSFYQSYYAGNDDFSDQRYFFSSHLVRKLLVKFVRYFKQNLAPVRFHVRHLQQSARALQYFEQTFSAQLWYLRHFNDYIVKKLKNAKDNPPQRTLCLQRLLLSSSCS